MSLFALLPALPFPQIDPVLIQIGPLAIRWYALAYIAGIILGWKYAVALVKRPPGFMEAARMDDFVVWATLGIVIGGRLGYALFYKPGHYLYHPAEILQVWQGGMSFHGGFLGMVAAIALFARKHKIDLLRFGDVIAAVVPIGLFFGRVANFINGELWGRTTSVAWGMVFPGGGPEPRHPSQLYQAALEGLALFLLLWLLERKGLRNRPGFMIGAFVAGYGLARMIGELFREPDAFLGFLIGGTTMGQWLSLPMLGVGLVLMVRAKPRNA